jgi:hypothetical protein
MNFRFRANRCDEEDTAMKSGIDRSKTLQELEQHDWGEPTYQSWLVKTCYRLRRKSLNRFTAEDLRIMIGQQISLPILIPLAMEALEAVPLVEARLYPGDLLAAVLKVDETFWTHYADSFQRVRHIMERVRDALPSLDEITGLRVQQILDDAPARMKST